MQQGDWSSVLQGTTHPCTSRTRLCALGLSEPHVPELHALGGLSFCGPGCQTSMHQETVVQCTGRSGLCARGCQSSMHRGGQSSVQGVIRVPCARAPCTGGLDFYALGCQTSMHQETGVQCTGGSRLCAPEYQNSTDTGCTRVPELHALGAWGFELRGLGLRAPGYHSYKHWENWGSVHRGDPCSVH